MNTNRCATGCAGPECHQGRYKCPHGGRTSAPESHWRFVDALIAIGLVAAIALVCIGAGA